MEYFAQIIISGERADILGAGRDTIEKLVDAKLADARKSILQQIYEECAECDD